MTAPTPKPGTLDEERSLERGFHYSRNGRVTEIAKMNDHHLTNAVNKGKAEGGEYWAWALPQLEEEVERRFQERSKS
jgi:hypothetical protein